MSHVERRPLTDAHLVRPALPVQAYDRENFNQAIDRKTGYRTRSMLVVPIRKTYNTSRGNRGEGVSSEPPIGVIQCINKLGTSSGVSAAEGVDDEGAPIFTSEDERMLEQFTVQITPILEKVRHPPAPPSP
jgi:hypothetical protein